MKFVRSVRITELKDPLLSTVPVGNAGVWQTPYAPPLMLPSTQSERGTKLAQTDAHPGRRKEHGQRL
ncbi:hypothetical protein ROHU_032235 [Labeo rohita]|uniref:Uncharacterized protein n=1 Tax=Labeo rohita TaxID=84645 RepID=A0A498LJ66_LABRO|nr:hypothetical protein ROHU_032235 [Labeo rohita]